jgi:hypothetical protein
MIPMRKPAKSIKSAKLKKPKIARPRTKTERLTIGLAGFEKVSAIEGLQLTRDMKRTFGAFEREGASAAERRAAIIKSMAERPRPVDV